MEHDTKKEAINPLAALGIFAIVCGLIWIVLYIKPPTNEASSGSTPLINTAAPEDTSETSANPVEVTNQPAVASDSSNTDDSDVVAFESSYQNYLTVSGKFLANVLVFNITGAVPEIQESTNDFSGLSSTNASVTNLGFAEDGILLIQKVSGKMYSSTEGLSSDSEDALLDLNTKAGAIQNPTFKKQALLVADDANELNQYIINYQSALEDKWSNVSSIFQDVINDNGYMTSAYAVIQTSDSQLDADNTVIGQLKTGTNPGYNMQTDFAQFKGMAEAN